MSGKLYCLNTRCYVSLLKMITMNYARHHNELAHQGKGEKMHAVLAQTPLTPFDDRRAQAFVHALIKSNVSSYLAYSEGDTQSDIMCELLFGDGVVMTNRHLAFVNDFLTVEEIDDLNLELDMHVGRYLERETWAVVDIFDTGNMISLVVQEDMRIREWKEMKGYTVGRFAPAMELDLSEMFAYLRIKTNRLLRPVDVDNLRGEKVTVKHPGDHIDYRSLVLDMLAAKYPFLRKEGQIGAHTGAMGTGRDRNLDLLVSGGLRAEGEYTLELNDDRILSVDHYLQKLVEPAVNSYSVNRYIKRLDNLNIYTLTIGIDNVLRVVRQEETTVKVNDNARIKDLVESYLRNDWLPPKEREEAERWIQENQ
ncbi:hypothetical protein FDI21_gp036 [Pseudomonas phage Noxifer]|uniref:Uncharacterized protein n=1 Tax=Pseudomonas phage Noxifer TaxID=2006684 RepID=A0A1Y0T2W2_9CAUD|nr:hypothetical protein FDI21_gp036 [Pseudomonas phage Noxifer]ARV77207.1 hypothetical protein NOXIFER_36 [Pseudomonas phage Noxifer]